MKLKLPNSEKARVRQLVRDITEGRAQFLVIATDSRRTRKVVVDEVKKELKSPAVCEVVLDELVPPLPEILDAFESTHNQVFFIYGLSELPDSYRHSQLQTLNLSRESLAGRGKPLVLWISLDDQGELQLRAGDFWAWCAGRYTFDLSTATAEFVQPGEQDLHSLAERLHKYNTQLAQPGLSKGTRAALSERIREIERNIGALALPLAVGDGLLLQEAGQFLKERLASLIVAANQTLIRDSASMLFGAILKEASFVAREIGGARFSGTLTGSVAGSSVASIAEQVASRQASAYTEIATRLKDRRFAADVLKLVNVMQGLQQAALAFCELSQPDLIVSLVHDMNRFAPQLPAESSKFWEQLDSVVTSYVDKRTARAVRQAAFLRQVRVSAEASLSQVRIPPIDLSEVRDKYLQQLRARFEYVDFRGIMQLVTLQPFRLQDIYVPLKLQLTRAAQRPMTELEWRHRFEAVQQSLFRKVGEEPEELPSPEAEAAGPKSLRDVLSKQQKLVVLGDPGSGKSTLVKYIALILASDEKQAQRKVGVAGLPVVMSLSLYGEALSKNKELGLLDFIEGYYRDAGLAAVGELLRADLSEGRCIVLLDGMDEIMRADVRRQVATMIGRFAERYVTSEKENRIVVTSRIAGYEAAPLTGFAHSLIATLEDDDIHDFARRWCLAYEHATSVDPERDQRGKQITEDLWQAIRSRDAIHELARRPLLLTILALIRRQGTTLPNRRVELYERCIETLAETWNRARSLMGGPIDAFLGGRQVDRQLVTSVLAPVAFWLHENEPSGAARRENLREQLGSSLKQVFRVGWDEAYQLSDEFLDLARLYSGILIERGVDIYAFAHRTFQEYLAAVHLAGKADATEFVRRKLHDPHWREVFLLAAASLPGDHATQFVREGVLKADSPHEHLLHRDLLMAAHCLADDIRLTAEGTEEEILTELGELWSRNPLRSLLESLASVLVAMSGTSFEREAKALLARGLRSDDGELRRVAAEALRDIRRSDKQLVDSLVTAVQADAKQNEEWRWSNAARAFAGLAARDPMARKAYVRLFDDPDPKIRALAALHFERPAARSIQRKLEELLSDSDAVVRGCAALALLSRTPHSLATQVLADTLSEEGALTRFLFWEAMLFPWQWGSLVTNALAAMLEAFGSIWPLLFQRWIPQISSILSEKIRPTVHEYLDHSDWKRREAGFAAMSRMLKPQEDWLDAAERALIADPEPRVRWAALCTLLSLGEDHTDRLKTVMKSLLTSDILSSDGRVWKVKRLSEVPLALVVHLSFRGDQSSKRAIIWWPSPLLSEKTGYHEELWVSSSDELERAGAAVIAEKGDTVANTVIPYLAGTGGNLCETLAAALLGRMPPNRRLLGAFCSLVETSGFAGLLAVGQLWEWSTTDREVRRRLLEFLRSEQRDLRERVWGEGATSWRYRSPQDKELKIPMSKTLLLSALGDESLVVRAAAAALLSELPSPPKRAVRAVAGALESAIKLEKPGEPDRQAADTLFQALSRLVANVD